MLSAAASATESTSIPRENGVIRVCADSVTLEWSVFLLRERPEKALIVFFGFGLILACSFALFHSIIVGLVAVAVAAGAVKEFLLPLRFKLDPAGASVRCGTIVWLELPWEQVLSVYRTPAGLKLSPYAHPRTARLEQLRGITLRFPRDKASEVEDCVNRLRQLSSERIKN